MPQEQQSTRNRPLLTPQVPAEDEDKVAAILGGIEEYVGFVPDGLRLYSISPPLLENYVNNILYFNQGGTTLGRPLCTMIRYLVSCNAGCHFCIDLNETFLTGMGYSLETVRAARDNPEAAPLEERERALLKLAVRGVDEPEDIDVADMQALYRYGWHDREIFDAVVQAAGNRAFNNVLRTFKVEQQGAFA